jgi:hypothetical protein
MSTNRGEMKRSDNSILYSGITGDRKISSLVCPINKMKTLGLLKFYKCDSKANFEQGGKGAA